MEEIKIEIRCKTCGKLYMGVELIGKIKYNFKCKRCKHWSTGTITNMNMEGKHGEK